MSTCTVASVYLDIWTVFPGNVETHPLCYDRPLEWGTGRMRVAAVVEPGERWSGGSCTTEGYSRQEFQLAAHKYEDSGQKEESPQPVRRMLSRC